MNQRGLRCARRSILCFLYLCLLATLAAGCDGTPGDNAAIAEPSPSMIRPSPTIILQPVQSQFADLWQKMREKRKAALATLPGYDAFPANATTWHDYAQRAFDDLLTHDDCWFDEPSTGIRGFRPYVKGTDGWGGVSRTRRITELMAEMDVVWPMYRYLQLHPDEESQVQVDEFIAELPKYYSASVQQSTNRPGETKHDSWYFMENSVLKYGHLYLISGNEVLQEPYFGSLGSAIDMAHNFDYLFPQFVNLQKQKADGYNTHNYSTAGLLAYSLIHAYQLTGDLYFLQEAEQALVSMVADAAPLDILYEPQELAAAAAAAAHMTRYAAEIGSTTDFADLASNYFYAQAWMIYYDGGKTDLPGFEAQRSDWLPKTWRDGLHSPYYNPVEAGGINAPAFKENFEAVLFWGDYLRFMYGRPGFDPVEPLKVLNLNRIKNFCFFSPNIPDEWERDFGPVSLQYVPYEDVDYYAVREYEDGSVREKAGYNGKQIYGAGETLWAYLAFEALGEASDRNALILNLNLFDREYPPAPAERAYVVLNPYPKERTLAFRLLHLSEPYALYADGQNVGDFQPGDAFEITLPALGSAFLTVETRS
jgi:hypothetical protein